MNVATPSKLLTVPEVARALRCTPASVRRRVREGDLPALRASDTGPLLIAPEDVERLLRPARTERRP